jgi:hypothetical protein
MTLNKAYRKKLAKLSNVSLDQVDHYYKIAFQRLNLADPVKDIALIAKVIKNLVRKEKQG